MSIKSGEYSQFTNKVLSNKVNLTAAENSAVTMYFGVTHVEDLISTRSVELYKQGEAIVKKVLELK